MVAVLVLVLVLKLLGVAVQYIDYYKPFCLFLFQIRECIVHSDQKDLVAVLEQTANTMPSTKAQPNIMVHVRLFARSLVCSPRRRFNIALEAYNVRTNLFAIASVLFITSSSCLSLVSRISHIRSSSSS